MQAISLPPPPAIGGAPLFNAFHLRRSTRDFADRPLGLGQLSELLWCAAGVNRPEGGGRTAPSTRHWNEIDIFVARADGLYRYDAVQHRLISLLAGDLRAQTGLQDFAARAPVNLVYVADLGRVDSADPLERRFYCGVDVGVIVQNVYLYCAAVGLATVVRGLLDRPRLAAAMRLGPRQRVLLAQSVGHPLAAAED